MIEAVEGLRFIDTTLRTNAPFMAAIPGGLFHALRTDLAEDAFPEDIFCVYQHLAGSDDLGGGAQRIATSNVYVTRITGPGTAIEAIETAAGLLDGLLHLAKGATDTGTIYYLLRQTANIQPEIVAGKLTLAAVQQYKSYIQRTGS